MSVVPSPLQLGWFNFCELQMCSFVCLIFALRTEVKKSKTVQKYSWVFPSKLHSYFKTLIFQNLPYAFELCLHKTLVKCECVVMKRRPDSQSCCQTGFLWAYTFAFIHYFIFLLTVSHLLNVLQCSVLFLSGFLAGFLHWKRISKWILYFTCSLILYDKVFICEYVSCLVGFV